MNHTFHFGFHSRTSLCAAAICAGVIFLAMMSRFFKALPRYSVSATVLPAAARLNHLYACT